MVDTSGAVVHAHKTGRWGGGGGGIQPVVRYTFTIYDRAEKHPPLPLNLTMALLPEILGMLLLIPKCAG